MERKTTIHAKVGKQELVITREFDLPVDLLFKAHADAALFEQWMSHEYGTTHVLKLEGRKHGSWQFRTVDADGNVLFGASGTIHEFAPDHKITRTFEMDDSAFDVQLEFLEFESTSDDTSKLTIHTVYRSADLRDKMLKLPFEYGLNMAHDRLQEVVGKLR
ncbi:MAG: SRPBCC domain-containing protein [Chloracidobacterium sp.]|nr:SRPBCC domain-containing protein [Chloracidobacterium sp.]